MNAVTEHKLWVITEEIARYMGYNPYPIKITKQHYGYIVDFGGECVLNLTRTATGKVVVKEVRGRMLKYVTPTIVQEMAYSIVDNGDVGVLLDQNLTTLYQNKGEIMETLIELTILDIPDVIDITEPASTENKFNGFFKAKDISVILPAEKAAHSFRNTCIIICDGDVFRVLGNAEDIKLTIENILK